jgi:hypothetical protein
VVVVAGHRDLSGHRDPAVPQGGQLKTYSMRSITSSRELRESMGVEASGAF